MTSINTGNGPSVAIIGAGIGGLSLGLELDRRGLTNWMLFEKDDGVGGTWWTNRYPGCRSDVPAVVYSHSRFQNPNWTQTHPPRAELQKYWQDLATNQNLMPRIRLRHEFVKADWQEDRKLYRIRVRDLESGTETVYEAQLFISAVGLLSTPNKIDIPGQDEFEGTVFHAANWPRDLGNEKLHGKTVVVVGNGCSGVQLVGTLGEDPNVNIISLARAPQWFVPSPPGEPRHSVAYSQAHAALWKAFPPLQWLERALTATIMDSKWYWYLKKDGAKFRAGMEKQLAAWMLQNLPKYMHDTAIPKHSFGSKRLIFEDGYFVALSRPNVRAVEGRIAALRSNAIVLDDGRELSADVVVMCTGYDAEHTLPTVNGRKRSTDTFKSRVDMKMYRGVGMYGFPNHFQVSGNNVGLNHMSITTVIELQAAYIGQLVQAMRDYNIPALDVKREAAEKYDEWVGEELKKTTWYQVKTYWRGDGGKGRIFTHYPGSVRQLWYANSSPIWSDWIGAEPVVQARRTRRVVALALVVLLAAYGVHVSGRTPVELLRSAATTVVDLGSGAVTAVVGRSKEVVEWASESLGKVGGVLGSVSVADLAGSAGKKL